MSLVPGADTTTALDLPVHQIQDRQVSAGDLLDGMRKAGATDLYLMVSAPVRFKRGGRVEAIDRSPLSRKALAHIIGAFLTQDDRAALSRRGAADTVVERQGTRYRVHVARGHTGPYVTIRVVGKTTIPLEKLGLHHRVHKRLTQLSNGVLILAGSTDAGKTVTCTSLLDHINKTREHVLLTLEDPIEYIIHPERCIVLQREVGLHVPTFAEGIRSALRENVDAIFVGEMRDVETMDQVMRAGETGHLVITTMHADDVLSAIGRIVGSYPQQEQNRVRQALAATLAGVVYQRLLPRKVGRGAAPGSAGRVPAVETLWTNTAVRTILRTGDFSKLGSYLGRATGGVSYKECLATLQGADVISEDTVQEENLRLQSGQ